MSAHRSSRRVAPNGAGTGLAAWPLSRLALALASVWGLSGVSTGAWANPTGAQAVAGSVQLQTQGQHLQVTTQNAPGTNHSVIQWQGFSIPAGNSTFFQQPTAASTSINRVVGADPSLIFGTLGSNGRLVLVNPAGITVGAGAVVDTAGFVASALRMSEADALAARLRFGDGSPGGNITVDGHIVSRQGDLVLIASQIDTGSSALLQSPQGTTILAAGGRLELTGRGLEGIRFEVQAPADAVRQLGRIEGDAVGVFAGSLRHSGVITAHAVSNEGGRVVLKAAGDAIVQDNARITAQGLAGAGGQVDVLGDRVAVRDTAQIDVSGPAGGGQVRIGGDYLGQNASVPNARYTYFGPQATLRADATEAGNGGRVIVWADVQTQAYGRISARGGDAGGDGGFVETSGKRRLDIGQAQVDAGAPKGKTGTWLLDPDFITVAIGGTETLGAVDQFADLGASLTIAPATINAAVANVVLQANEDISIDNAINMTNPGVSFTAQAGGYVFVNANITTRGGQVDLFAGNPGSLTTPTEGALYLNANIDTTGGGTVPGGANVALTSFLSDVGGNSIVLGTAGGPTEGSINAGTTSGVTLFTNNIGINQADGVITAAQLVATADNDIFMNRANSIGSVTLAVTGASASGGISFRNNRANYSLDGVSYVSNTGAVSIVGTGNVSIDGDITSGVSVAISQTGNITNGGGLIETTSGDIGLGGAAIGATGAGNYMRVKSAGDVFLTASSGGIYVQQASGPLLTSTYNVSAAGVGQEIKLAAAGTFGSTLQIDGFAGYNANTNDDDLGFYNVATNGSINIDGGITKTAHMVDIGAEGSSGTVNVGTGTVTFNASHGAYLSALNGTITLAGNLTNNAVGADAGFFIESGGNISGGTSTVRTTGGGQVLMVANQIGAGFAPTGTGSVLGTASINTTASSAAVASGEINVSTGGGTGSLSLGTVTSSGAAGAADGEAGGNAGLVRLSVWDAGSMAVQAVNARGGAGADGSAADGGAGGNGANVNIRRVTAGPLALNNLSVNTSGGAGGDRLLAGGSGGNGGNAGSMDIYASNGVLTLGGTSAQLMARGGAGGNANPASGDGGDGGSAAVVYLGDFGNTSNAQGLAFNTATTIQLERGAAGTAPGGTPGSVGSSGTLRLTAGTGGITQTAALSTGADATLLLDVGASNVVLGNAANVLDTVTGDVGGAVTVRGLTSASNLSAGQDIVLDNPGGLVLSGNVIASGAASSVTVTSASIVQVLSGLVQAGTGGISITSSGDSVGVVDGSLIASGDVNFASSASFAYVYSSTVQSTGGDVSINGTPLSPGSTAVLVASNSGGATQVLAADTVQIGGGLVRLEAIDAAVKVEGNVVTIGTGGENLIVSGSDTVAGASAKVLAGSQMNLNLGGGVLSVEGGAAANAYALVGSTSGSATVAANSGFVNLLGGTGAGSYSGLVNVGGDLTTTATLNLVPDLSTGGGVLVAANNFSSLTINPVGATPVLYAALTVDANTGVVTDAGTPLAVTGIVAGGGVALPPAVPGDAAGAGTADINQSLLALLLQDLLRLLGPDGQLPQTPEQRAAQNPDDVVAEAEICR